MAKCRQAVELAMTDEEAEVLTALSRSRTEPASRVSRAAVVLCRGTKAWRAPSDGSTLRRASRGVRRTGGTRRPTATGQGAGDHA